MTYFVKKILSTCILGYRRGNRYIRRVLVQPLDPTFQWLAAPTERKTIALRSSRGAILGTLNSCHLTPLSG